MDFSSVNGKVAIVTGASRGIGRAIAECFGENGMKVVCAARSAEQGRAVADGICAKGGDAIFIQTDCSKASAIKELVDKTVTHYGKLDGVVYHLNFLMFLLLYFLYPLLHIFLYKILYIFLHLFFHLLVMLLNSH